MFYALIIANTRYHEYAAPLQNTYDNIVAKSQALLRGLTLDERASRLRAQFKSKEVIKDCHLNITDTLTYQYRL